MWQSFAGDIDAYAFAYVCDNSYCKLVDTQQYPISEFEMLAPENWWFRDIFQEGAWIKSEFDFSVPYNLWHDFILNMHLEWEKRG